MGTAMLLGCMMLLAPLAEAPKELADGFASPPRHYSIVPLWFWNDDLDPAEACRQLDEMKAQGVHAAFVTAHTGLITPYLSDDWWKVVDACVKHADSTGMQLWIYDEYNWPSGAANGRASRGNPAFCDRRIDCERRTVTGPATFVTYAGGDDFIAMAAGRQVPEGQPQAGQVDPDSLIDLTAKIVNRKLTWDVPNGTWHVFVFREVTGDSFDLLNPEATRKFIDLTRNEYARRYGKLMPRVIPGTFTDEPASRLSPPWTPSFLKEFKSRRGYDLKPYVPALFIDTGNATDRYRCDYWQTVAELYAEGYLKPLYDWCQRRGVAAAGHLLTEESLLDHAKLSGDPFQVMAWEHVPGVDCVGGPRRLSPVSIKTIASVAHQLGRERMLSKTFAGCGWPTTFEEMKWVVDWQYAQGVNLLAAHAFHYKTDRDETRNDWPPSMFHQQPYWRHYKHFADYVARLSYLLSRGRNACDVAVYYPIESVWANSSPDRAEKAKHINAVFAELTQKLVTAQVDIDYVDAAGIERAKAARGTFAVGPASYRLLVLPPMTTIRRSTIKQIARLQMAGVKVISIEALPTASMEKGRGDPQLAEAIKAAFPNGPHVDNVKDALPLIQEGFQPDVVINPATTEIVCQHRKLDAADIYFISSQSGRPMDITATLRTRGQPQLWLPYSGERVAALASPAPDEATRVGVHLDPFESVFVVFGGPEVPAEPFLTQLRNGQPPKAWHPDRPVPATGPWMFSIDGGSMKILSAKMAMTGKDDNPVAPGFDDSKWPEVRLGQITATAVAAWNANWMTFSDENATLYFRKTVDLDADPAQGLICISVDNLYTLFVNGERAGGENDENGWRNAEVHNVTRHLRRGRNVIAVEARNLGGPGGVLLEGMIVLADGRRLKILSNNTWKVSPEADANWAKPDFDDSKWAPAQQGPRPPEGVWQEVAGLTPEIASGPSGTTWYRFVAPLVADALVLPGIVQEVYVGGKPVTVTDGRVKIEPSKLVALKCSDELPAPIICKTASAPTELKPWTALGIPRFSGSGVYQTTVKVPELRDGDELMLDLGDARIAAQVWVNDEQAGTRIWQPYRFRITRLVKPGENSIKVLVTNTLGNEISAFALSGGGQYDKMPPDRLTSGLLGPVQLQLYRVAR